MTGAAMAGIGGFRRVLAAAVLAVPVALAAGCSYLAPAPSASRGPAAIESPVDGQVVSLDTEGLTRVRGFVLRTDEALEIPFVIGILENGVEFPPSHLAEHMATGSPVRISFRSEDGVLVVYRIQDASGP